MAFDKYRPYTNTAVTSLSMLPILLLTFSLSNISFSLAGPGYERQKDRNLAFENYVTKEQLPGLPIMFRCSLCGKSMAQKRNALNHVENIHFPGSFIHQCSTCGKELKSKEALNNHVRTHKDVQKVYKYRNCINRIPFGSVYP